VRFCSQIAKGWCQIRAVGGPRLRSRIRNGWRLRTAIPHVSALHLWHGLLKLQQKLRQTSHRVVRKTASSHKTTECKSDWKLAAKFLWQPSYSAVIFLLDVMVASRVVSRRIGLTTDKTVDLLYCWFIVITNVSNAD